MALIPIFDDSAAPGGGLLPASFRGVACHVASRQISGGRRGPLHEFADRDEPETEDTGRKAQKFTVTAFVVGEDALEQADSLQEALDSFGPGLWCDPWRGEVRVQARDFTRTDSLDLQDYVSFSITFEESAEDSSPTFSPDHRRRVKEASADLSLASVAAFARDFDLSGLPGYAVDAAVETAAAVLLDLDVDFGVGFDLAEALRGGFAERVFDLLFGDDDALSDRNYGAIVQGWPDRTPPRRSSLQGDTPVRQRMRRNDAALSNFGYGLALAGRGPELLGTDFDNANSAVVARDNYTAQLHREGLRTSGGTVYDDGLSRTCFALAACCAADIDARAVRLPRLVTIKLDRSMPAVVAAHKYLGDARRGDDLVSRNRLPNPAFCPVVRRLEALP